MAIEGGLAAFATAATSLLNPSFEGCSVARFFFGGCVTNRRKLFSNIVKREEEVGRSADSSGEGVLWKCFSSLWKRMNARSHLSKKHARYLEREYSKVHTNAPSCMRDFIKIHVSTFINLHFPIKLLSKVQVITVPPPLPTTYGKQSSPSPPPPPPPPRSLPSPHSLLPVFMFLFSAKKGERGVSFKELKGERLGGEGQKRSGSHDWKQSPFFLPSPPSILS